MWKAAVRLGDVRVPVKLYAAVEDRDVHFRLLHRADHAPVKQVMVNPRTTQVVPYREARRAYDAGAELVLLRDEELASLEPAASRDIEIVQRLPAGALDHRWYLRPYYLGPDESDVRAYVAMAEAFARFGSKALARWTMRKKEYTGTLRVHGRHLMLIALRHAEDVVTIDELKTPAGAALDERELQMARQLIDMLADDFRPKDYTNRYRARVRELLRTKAEGGEIRPAPRALPRASEDLAAALAASLEREQKRA
jgi:DNA end-binding protein Ku